MKIIRIWPLTLLVVTFTACRPQSTGYSEQDATETTGGLILSKTLTTNEVQFAIYSGGNGSMDTLVIIPSGFEIENETLKLPIDGQLTDAFVDDINRDGYPEFYLVAVSAGSGSYATLYAFASYRNKSYGPIYIPGTDPALLEGYMGHDTYFILANKLMRKYPVYLKGDVNAQPSGGERLIEYYLEKGEASFILRAKPYEGPAD